jgi:hypothetical protein
VTVTPSVTTFCSRWLTRSARIDSWNSSSLMPAWSSRRRISPAPMNRPFSWRPGAFWISRARVASSTRSPRRAASSATSFCSTSACSVCSRMPRRSIIDASSRPWYICWSRVALTAVRLLVFRGGDAFAADVRDGTGAAAGGGIARRDVEGHERDDERRNR